MRAITSAPPPLKPPWDLLVLTEAKIKHIWEEIQKVPLVFDDSTKGNFNDFVSKFFVPNNVFVDIGPDLGLAAGFAVRPGLDAVLHLVMFDRKLRGREPLFLEIMAYFFKRLQLRRMTAMIAEDAQVGIKLVQRLGFIHEGCIRKSILRNGQYLDTHIFGVLREELSSTPVEIRGQRSVEAHDTGLSATHT